MSSLRSFISGAGAPPIPNLGSVHRSPRATIKKGTASDPLFYGGAGSLRRTCLWGRSGDFPVKQGKNREFFQPNRETHLRIRERFNSVAAGSNPGHDTNHFVLRFRLSFRSPGNWLRGHAATFTEHASLREKWQGASALPSSSNVNFLRDIQGIVHLNAQIPDGAFNLRMSKEKLNCSQISGSTVDECSLGSP